MLPVLRRHLQLCVYHDARALRDLDVHAYHSVHNRGGIELNDGCVVQGPSTAQLKQDSNAFETARKEWGGKAVSSRGKVGGLGMDIQNASWLG